MWLLHNFPPFLLPLIGGGLAAVVFRFAGWRWALVVIAAFLLFTVMLSQRQAGWNDREIQGKEDAREAIKDANDARNDSDRHNADPERLRSQDGFRRD